MTTSSFSLVVVKAPAAELCCPSHLCLLLWLQLQELDVYTDLLPFLAVRGFAFMRGQQLLELYFALPEEEREKSPRAAELVFEYNEWQLVQCENPSKNRQASSGYCSVVWMLRFVGKLECEQFQADMAGRLRPVLQGRALRSGQH